MANASVHLIKIVKALQIKLDKKDTDLIFDLTGKANPANLLSKRIKRFFAKTKWAAVQSHDFRGSWVTDAYNKEVDIRTISKLLGHSKISTTDEHYIKVSQTDDLKKVARLMSH
jgi:integrase